MEPFVQFLDYMVIVNHILNLLEPVAAAYVPVGQQMKYGAMEMKPSGAANEVWSYGDEAYEIFRKYIFLRERIKPYITEIMKEAHEKGTPVIRPLFYDFPQDKLCFDITDQYMFGPDILVAPILYKGQRARKVYLPEGAKWKEVSSEKTFNGGQWIDCDAPLERIPLFLRDEADIPITI
jgi:alpha-D-xyloside xylohydrolase